MVSLKRRKSGKPRPRLVKSGRRVKRSATAPERPLGITFLVGAGLVKDAGLPLSVDLARKFNAYLEEGATSDTGAKALLALNRFLNGGIRFQMGVLDRDPEQTINIEHLATAALRLN